MTEVIRRLLILFIFRHFLTPKFGENLQKSSMFNSGYASQENKKKFPVCICAKSWQTFFASISRSRTKASALSSQETAPEHNDGDRWVDCCFGYDSCYDYSIPNRQYIYGSMLLSLLSNKKINVDNIKRLIAKALLSNSHWTQW